MADRVILRGLRVDGPAGPLVQDVGLELVPGQVTVLVGASGSGKSLTTRSLVGLVDLHPGVVAADLEVEAAGSVTRPYSGLGGGRGLGRRARDRAFAPVRGAVVGWLPQDARGSLDPLRRVGAQVQACLRLRRDGVGLDPLPWLQRAGLTDATRVAGLYPHELSGGMAQRAGIALALARGSRFLLADEPTTGLDPTVQEGILFELLALKAAGVGILLVTHDLRLVPRVGDRLLVMDGGRVVDDRPTSALDTLPADGHPAARSLWEATSRIAPWSAQ